MTIKKKKAKKRLQRKRPTKKRAAKKRVVRRTKKLVTKKALTLPKSGAKEKVIGVVTHYFPKVRAAAIKLKASLNLGETIRIKGHTTDFKQNITSMQIERVPVETAKKGQEIGLLVDSRARQHDLVYKA